MNFYRTVTSVIRASAHPKQCSEGSICDLVLQVCKDSFGSRDRFPCKSPQIGSRTGQKDIHIRRIFPVGSDFYLEYFFTEPAVRYDMSGKGKCCK